MKRWALFLSVLAMLVLPVLAMADTYSIMIYDGNDALDPFAAPYATVLIDLVDATHATITFAALSQNGNDYLMGGANTVGVNVNATTWTLSNIVGTNSNAGFTPGPYTDTGSGNVSDFGIFNQTITGFDGYQHSADLITFGLTNTSGTWASAADVLDENDSDYYVEAHIFVTGDPALTTNSALATGFAADGAAAPAPEPATLLLLGSGLVGAGIFSRKRLGRKQS
jgi:PEP-CTERM motif